ncbi:MAG: NAD(P)-binding domain-containing protein [Dehalococcoidia bacterium]|nr:NAD(P)-binding domain-containing protein [Dehalococcoidia bacterium]
MSKFKVIFLYQEPWETERFQAGVGEAFEVVGFPQRTDVGDIDSSHHDAQMVVGGAGVRSAETALKYSQLRLIQTLSAGTDTIPKVEMSEMGIRVANNMGGNAVAVSEVTVALIVSTYRRLMVQWNQLNNKGIYSEGFGTDWGRFHELTGKRVGVIGLGQIGSRVAKRLAGWECEIVYSDVKSYSAEYESAAGATRVDFDELIETSDVITLHVPLDRLTEKLLSDREFARMKPGAIVINACRGPVVDEAALVRALDDNQIAGAGLDVTEIEPVEMSNALIGRENVVLIPHNAGMSVEARQKSIDHAVANAKLLMAGDDPVGIVLPV